MEEEFLTELPDLWCQEGDLQSLIQAIANGLDINWKSKHGHTLLQIAGSYNQLEIIEFLLEKGADTTGAVFYAVRNGYGMAVRMLLMHGVKVNEPDAESPFNTPLIYAAACRQEHIADILLKAGADRTYRNANGQTAADWARMAGSQGLAEKLRPQPEND